MCYILFKFDILHVIIDACHPFISLHVFAGLLQGVVVCGHT